MIYIGDNGVWITPLRGGKTYASFLDPKETIAYQIIKNGERCCDISTLALDNLQSCGIVATDSVVITSCPQTQIVHYNGTFGLVTSQTGSLTNLIVIKSKHGVLNQEIISSDVTEKAPDGFQIQVKIK